MYRNLKILLENYGSKEPTYFGPKEHKRKWMNWLKKWFDYEVHEDGSISIPASVYMHQKNLTRLPFNFREVDGNFNCSANQLETLEGAPRIVKGEFDCSYNRLTSLKGAPRIVLHGFDCSYNNLTSLVGAPEKVKFNFDCSFNDLKTLDGAPEEIGKTFKNDKFSDEDYRNFVKKRKYVDRKIEPEFDIDLNNF